VIKIIFTQLDVYIISDFKLFSQQEFDEASDYITGMNDRHHSSFRFTRAADGKKPSPRLVVCVKKLEFLIYLKSVNKWYVYWEILTFMLNRHSLVIFNVYNFFAHVNNWHGVPLFQSCETIGSSFLVNMELRSDILVETDNLIHLVTNSYRRYSLYQISSVH
jgi:hypothetical protein